MGVDGAACEADSDCIGGLCLTEATFGFPGGLCTEDCNESGTCRDPSSVCDITHCVRRCDPELPGSCGIPTTLACHTTTEHIGQLKNPHVPGDDPNAPVATQAYCAADCKVDTDCTGGRICDHDPLRPRCVEPENCSNMQNDNITQYVSDCEDGTCAGDADCIATYAQSCADAQVLQVGRTTGDTSAGSIDFVGNCAGDNGSPEILYSFTPPTTGEYGILLTSDADLGFYLREECTERSSEIGCRNLYPGGTPEEGFVSLAAGTTYTLVVDGGWLSPRQGPFTIDINPRGCGDKICDYLPGDAVDGQSECTSCATDCMNNSSCGFCLHTGECHVPTESMTCSECAEFADPLACTDDGFCDQAREGCVCADCSAVSNCSP